MLIYTIPIRDDAQTVSLETYLLKNSPEFQTNIRRPAVIICPGGGYRFTSDREAEPVALRFFAHGYHAFVLRYSVQTPFPQPILDLLDNTPIPWGSDGTPVQPGDAIVSTLLGNEADHALKERYRLDLHVSPSTPPTFLWHTATDPLVPSLNALRFATARAVHRVPYELHIFESGVHGLSLADETMDVDGLMINPHAQMWIDLALKWLKRQTPKRSPSTLQLGDEIELYFEMQRIHLFDPDDEHCITSRPPEPSLGLTLETGRAAPSSKGAN